MILWYVRFFIGIGGADQEDAMDIKKDTGTRPSAEFPFESRFVSIGGYRIHYVEEGQGDPVLFIHGNPTSSYLWRNILPQVAREADRRGIALDLLGFGKSDKPDDVRYTLQLHYDILEGFIEKLDLKNIILVLHDWGGPLGTAYAVRHPENVRGMALMETFLWNMLWDDFGRFKPVFRLFRSPAGYLMIQVMNIFVNKVLPGSVVQSKIMTKEIMRHYREPFPTIKSRRAVRVFPQLLPIECRPAESHAFIEEIEQKLPAAKFPVLWIKASPGAVISENTAYRLIALKERLPQLEVKEFGPGLHYLQEDDPKKVVELIVEWMRLNNMLGKEEAPSQDYRKVA
jgi:haloalkane dehalogenase